MSTNFLNTDVIVKSPTSLKTLFGNFNNVKRCSSPRQQLVKDFYDRLVKDRGSQTFYLKDGKKVKLTPYTPRNVAIRMGHFKTVEELGALYSSCKHAKSFEKTWWYLTKITTVK